MNNLSIAASTWVILFGVIIWIGAAWLCVTNWKRNGKRKSIGVLEGLRFLLITLIAFTLLRPEFIQNIKRTDSPEIAILMDNSASMTTRDIVGAAASGQSLTNNNQSPVTSFSTNRALTRSEWMEQKRAAEFWKPLEKSGKVVLENFASPNSATNSERENAEQVTDLNRALENAAQRPGNLKAVLLLTDGDWNAGKSPLIGAGRLREQNIPVFSVTVGRQTPIPDVVLESVTAPSYGLLGEQIAIPFRIRSHLGREVKTEITLADPTWDEVTKEITIPAQGEITETILWLPRAIGEATLTLKLPVQEDEGIAENNEHTFRINIREDKLKVLVVDSLPRWEYRYLRNALARDPGVEMNSILFHPEIGVGGGRDYLSEFPKTKEAIAKYDVIFLGDVGIGDNELSDAQAELIKGLIEQQSSGLVFLPGRRGRQSSFLESPLAELYPVVLDATKKEGVGLQNEAQLTLSTTGRRHLLTRFDSEENRNDELWKMLPGFFWSAAVEKSRPGSEVLAVHSSLRNSFGRMPLLVTRSAGSGKVLFMGTDSAWRWRRGVEDKFHYRFWSQVVRWMSHQRHLSEDEGIRLSYSPETPHVGDTMFLQSTVMDSTGYPAENETLVGRITSPDNRSERLEFSSVEGGWGVFKSSFAPQQGGKYKIQLTSEKNQRKLETEIIVSQPVREKIGQPVNAEILREIANITGGASVSYEQLEEIVQKISLLPEPKPVEKRIRLWSSPIWGGIILFLLGVYWTGRKLAGMV
ncbi:MAG: VWA domain-containing protein [Verrucomicrobia bacterium]|nr:VWA domain-containing protein [Verrucomicrobiota bacterium]